MHDFLSPWSADPALAAPPEIDLSHFEDVSWMFPTDPSLFAASAPPAFPNPASDRLAPSPAPHGAAALRWFSMFDPTLPLDTVDILPPPSTDDWQSTHCDPPIPRDDLPTTPPRGDVLKSPKFSTSIRTKANVKRGLKRLKSRGRMFPMAALTVLNDWLQSHAEDPYPSAEEKEALAAGTGLTVKQVTTWLGNARSRDKTGAVEQWLSSSSDSEPEEWAALPPGVTETVSAKGSDGKAGGGGSARVENSSVAQLGSEAVLSWSGSINPSTGEPCTASYTRAYELIHHQDTVHAARKRILRCGHCAMDKAFANPDELGRHIIAYHPDDTVPPETKWWLPAAHNPLQPPVSEAVSAGRENPSPRPAEIPSSFRGCGPTTRRPPIRRSPRAYSDVSDDAPNAGLSGASSVSGSASSNGSAMSQCSDARWRAAARRGRKKFIAAPPRLGGYGNTSPKPAVWSTTPPRVPGPPTHYPCTFCHKLISKNSWKRHEEETHLPRYKWTCMPEGFVTFESPTLPYPRCVPDQLDQPKCLFCDLRDPPDDHAEQCPHGIAQCLAKPEGERTFYRMEHMKRHLVDAHGPRGHSFPGSDPGPGGAWDNGRRPERLANMWCSEIPYEGHRWTCGFCGVGFDNWDRRAAHLVRHFRMGSTMDHWSNDRLEVKSGSGLTVVSEYIADELGTGMEGTATHNALGRRRKRLACLECCRRKLKCDGSSPSCTHCTRAGRKCIGRSGQHGETHRPRTHSER